MFAVFMGMLMFIGCGASKNKTPEDGTYKVNVTMEGGSGKASVQSPTDIQVKDGQISAAVVWSSEYYDYMLVDDEKYLNESTEGNSSFTIPVKALGEDIAVIADTTAMSVPHEIEYTLNFELVE